MDDNHLEQLAKRVAAETGDTFAGHRCTSRDCRGAVTNALGRVHGSDGPGNKGSDAGQDGSGTIQENNHRRVVFAGQVIANMAEEAACDAQCGTIGVEIPVKDGRLGRVKRVQILFQQE